MYEAVALQRAPEGGDGAERQRIRAQRSSFTILRAPIALLIACLLTVAPGALVAGEESSSGRAGSTQVSGSSKISPLLARTLDRMKSAGVSRETIGSHDLEQFSDPLVRVDREGRVHAYVYLDRLDEPALAELRAAGVAVELANGEHRIVQGWIPFDSVERVAQMANVTRIRPPDYVIPRNRSREENERRRSGSP